LIPRVAWDQEEDETLTVNFGFWVELEAKLAGRPNDTSINIHQLARNIELMEERVVKAEADLKTLVDANAKAETDLKDLPDPMVLDEDNDKPYPLVDIEPFNNSKMDVDTEWKAVKARAKKVTQSKVIAESESKAEMYDDACNSWERGSRSMGGGCYTLWSGFKTEAL
jgi:hypothetical protein